MGEKETAENLMREMEGLKAELQEREKSLPAHTIRPHQLLAIEGLEDKIRVLDEKLKEIRSQEGSNEEK